MNRFALCLLCALSLLASLPAASQAKPAKQGEYRIYMYDPGISGSARYELGFSAPVNTCGKKRGSRLDLAMTGDYRWKSPKKGFADWLSMPVKPFGKGWSPLYTLLDTIVKFRVDGEVRITAGYDDTDCDGRPLGRVSVSCRVTGSEDGAAVMLSAGRRRGRYVWHVLPVDQLDGIVRLDDEPKGCAATRTGPAADEDWQYTAIQNVLLRLNSLPPTVGGDTSKDSETNGRSKSWTTLGQRLSDKVTVSRRDLRRRTISRRLAGRIVTPAGRCPGVIAETVGSPAGEIAGCRESVSWSGGVRWRKRCGPGSGSKGYLHAGGRPGFNSGMPSFGCDSPGRKRR